ncbi:protein shisa-5 isoform X6 [Musca domestica]|uniref:Protein shisa-5 isoform X1 n=1 Tax=Musca domestica TaxID=7370 RepID=A0A1I8NGJ6_MUSDO|nr:protein shisa-5 isoform X6 [Musca domestica]
MPIFAIVFFIIFGIVALTILICWCALLISCIKNNNRDQPPCYSQATSAPIVVTSATHTAPGGYPVSQMPVGATTATTATAYQTQSYATPYPPQGAPTQMPMPMPACPPGVQPPHVAPYPPMPSAAPPSYDVAVSGAGAGVPNNGSYEKQAPYNPNFSG